ncbi:MAG: DHH family phosphoesterase [Candidatus Methanomethylicia archaeon]|nr:DHH family phosphoesterase [Candidatus Methanomethylicia archaeon]
MSLLENSLPNNFIDLIKLALERINEWVNSRLFFNVFTHLDADGLTSGGIFSCILKHLEVPFKVRVLNQLTIDVISNLNLREDNVAIFIDFGSGQKSSLDKFLKVPYMIIDHHQPQGEFKNNDRVIEVNPHYFGINGSIEISSSGLAYLLVRNFSGNFIFLSPIAIVGALGDRQDCGDKSSLIGINKLIVDEAVMSGFLDVKIGLKLFGFEYRPIVKSIEYTVDPVIIGLSGNFNACMTFLKNIGIPPVDENGIFRRASDMSSDEIRKLIVEIIKYMLSHGFSSNVVESIIGTTYILTRENSDSCLRDAREFSSILNACGRMGFPSYGLALCMGIRGNVLRKAFEISNEYRKEISRMLNWFDMNKDKLLSYPNVYSIDTENNVDERLLSTFLSIISTRAFLSNKPVLGFVLTKNNSIKVSCRANQNLVNKGINLGLAARLAAEAVGGSGGGHHMAAGAEIPYNSKEKFLKAFDEIIGKQISCGKYE